MTYEQRLTVLNVFNTFRRNHQMVAETMEILPYAIQALGGGFILTRGLIADGAYWQEILCTFDAEAHAQMHRD